LNWEAIGTIVDAIGVVAVIVTLFYLAVQIRQNTIQARRNELGATLEQGSVVRMALAQNQDLAELWIAGLNDYDSLPEAHKVRFDSLMRHSFWIWFHVFDRISKAVYERKIWGSSRYQLQRLLSSPGTRLWWSRNYGQFPEDYVDEVNAIINGQNGA
jgi:hypothetical protein